MKNRQLLILFTICLASLSVAAQDWKVFFSANGGFYEDVFELELFSTYPQGRIFYTTNGNRPTVQSRLYTEPLVLDAGLYSQSDIYTIVNCIPSTFYLPDSIQHAILIRAAIFDENDSCVSAVTTNSYFIRALGNDFHGLPVLSIAADSLALFDYETGIFVPGINYDPADSISTGNFKMKGREWERLINVEFYEPNNQGINQECGLRAHGGASRWFQQKGMKLYAREEYGKKRFSHRFFETTPIEKFKRLCLHPFRCSNWWQTGGQDYLSHTIARNLDFEALAVRETVVFINGEYWGIYTLEESPDERYLEDHFDLDLDSITVIKYWGMPDYGDLTEWRNFYYWMISADLSQPEDSAYAYSHVDVSSLTDYLLFETFSANLDWPANNVRIWQAKPGALFRWFFYDGDGCFTWPNYPALENAFNFDVNSVVISHFFENEGFVRAFKERYFQLFNSYFSYDYMKSVLDEYSRLVEGEIESQSKRFQFPVDTATWYAHIAKVDEFLSARDSYFRTELDLSSIEEWETPWGSLGCYPNPFSDEIRISITAEQRSTTEICIYDMMGRKVFEQSCQLEEGENRITITPKVKAGLYMLKAGIYTQLVVKH